MSLLEELLRKAEKKTEKVDIPPQLEKIVERRNKRRQTIFFVVFFTFFSGIAFLFIVNEQRLSLSQKKSGSEFREQKVEVAKENLQKALQEPLPSGPASAPGTHIVDEENRKVETSAPVKTERAEARIKARMIKEQSRKEQKYSTRVELSHPPISPINPIETPPQPSGLSERRELLYRAGFHEARDEYERAIEYYERILKIDPSDYRVLNQIVYLYVKLGIPEKAIDYARRLRRIRPDYIPGMMNHSVALIMKEEYKEAEAILREILAVEPQNKTALYNLAIVFEKEERYDEAGELYRRLSLAGDTRGNDGLRRIELKKSLIEKNKKKERKD